MTVSEVTKGVWRAGTRWVNWYVVDAGQEGCVLIDAGFPAYHKHLAQSLLQAGKQPRDVRALALTHGHIDHVGMAPYLADLGIPVFLHPSDAKLAANPKSNQTEKNPIPYLRYPAILGFTAHALINGALRPSRTMPATSPLREGPQAALPGCPIVTHTPGHTDGSCVLEFKSHGVVFVGDLLCTVSPVTGRYVAPQLQTRGSNRNSRQAMKSLDRLTHVDAPLVLPGHGRVWNDGIEAAAATAKRAGCR